jgi:hypothetical protein
MRKDLAKLTTEKERRGGSGTTKKFGGRVRVSNLEDYDYPNEVGGFHSTARHRVWGWNAKEFSDVLNPLKGTLHKNLGRVWDEVFSEFCEVLDRRSNSGYHIWTHLMQMVSTKTVMLEDGRVGEIRDYGYAYSLVSGFYVHPVTGILKYEEPIGWKRRGRESWLKGQMEADLDVPKLPGWKYRQINGLWFRYNSNKAVVEKYWGLNYSTWLAKEREKDPFFGYEVRSCSKKEIAWILKQKQLLAKKLGIAA